MAAATTANLAARAVRAGTKLRKHYLNLTVANNIFLAIYVHYDLEAEYGATQKMFLKALIDVDRRAACWRYISVCSCVSSHHSGRSRYYH